MFMQIVVVIVACPFVFAFISTPCLHFHAHVYQNLYVHPRLDLGFHVQFTLLYTPFHPCIHPSLPPSIHPMQACLHEQEESKGPTCYFEGWIADEWPGGHAGFSGSAVALRKPEGFAECL